MFCAPAVAWETSAPPTTPRGTSRSGPGLTTLMGGVYLRLPGRHLDLNRGLCCRLRVDLECRVADAETLIEQALELAPAGMTVIAGMDHDVCRQRIEVRGHLPHVQIVHLDHAGMPGQRAADLCRVEVRWGGLHEDPSRRLEQAVGGVQHQPGDQQ